MARGTTLGDMLVKLASEMRMSVNPAHMGNVRASHVQALGRVQDRLYTEWDWEHLKVKRPIVLAPNVRYYACPADIAFDRITGLLLYQGGKWTPLSYGVNFGDYSIYNSPAGESGWPPEKWAIGEEPTDGNNATVDDVNNIEIWPVPSVASGTGDNWEGRVMVQGIRRIKRPVNDVDRFEIDDTLVSLYTAAELLSPLKQSDSTAKLQQAQQLYFRLRSKGYKTGYVDMVGDDPADRSQVIIASPLPKGVSV